jgi:hypothetical protein
MNNQELFKLIEEGIKQEKKQFQNEYNIDDFCDYLLSKDEIEYKDLEKMQFFSKLEGGFQNNSNRRVIYSKIFGINGKNNKFVSLRGEKFIKIDESIKSNLIKTRK